MKTIISNLCYDISWGGLLGFIIGINIALVMNFMPHSMTSSIEILQFVFDHATKWTLIGIGLSLIFRGSILFYFCVKKS